MCVKSRIRSYQDEHSFIKIQETNCVYADKKKFPVALCRAIYPEPFPQI